MNYRHPWQLKKLKSWVPFWSYTLNTTADLANFEVNRLDWQCCLADSSNTAPRILFFSIAMDADNSFYVKFIATEAPTFFGYIISVLAMVTHSFIFFTIYQLDKSFMTTLSTNYNLWITVFIHELSNLQ